MNLEFISFGCILLSFQARNFMRDQMKSGHLAFFYHSNCKNPGIAAIVEVKSHIEEGFNPIVDNLLYRLNLPKRCRSLQLTSSSTRRISCSLPQSSKSCRYWLIWCLYYKKNGGGGSQVTYISIRKKWFGWNCSKMVVWVHSEFRDETRKYNKIRGGWEGDPKWNLSRFQISRASHFRKVYYGNVWSIFQPLVRNWYTFIWTCRLSKKVMWTIHNLIKQILIMTRK